MKTILIVEDVDLNIDLLTQILEDDYKIIVAKNGEEGVAFTKLHKPDLVLMDIAMPIMDGYEATRLIRKSFPGLPVIGISSHAMSGDAEKAKASGCTDYLTKPIDEDLLLQKIKEYLA